MKENSITVFNYVKEHDGEDFTAADIAEATGLDKKSVNGILTMSFQRHKDADKNIVPLIEREAADVENGEGGTTTVKFIRLTEAGKAFTPSAD